MSEQEWSDTQQRAILRALIEGRLNVQPDTVDPSVFTESRLPFAESIIAYRDRRHEWPSTGILKDQIFSRFPKRKQEQMLAELTELERLTKGEVEEVSQTAGDDMRKAALFQAVLDVEELLDEEPSQWVNAQNIISKALNVGQPLSQQLDYLNSFEQRYSENHSQVIRVPTGMEQIDRALGGGLKGGELGLLMAPTNRGKSQFMVYFGYQALLKQIPVLFISLEMQFESVASRFDRCISDMTQAEIVNNLGRCKKKTRALCEPDMLNIHVYPRKSVGPSTIFEHCEEAYDKWQQPFLLIIDYIALMKDDAKKARHKAVADQCADVCAIGQEFKIPVWSPHQTNREAESDSKGLVSLNSTGESYEVAQHVDVILCPNQSPAQKKSGVMEVHTAKVRDSGYGRQVIKTVWEKSRVKPMVSEDEVSEGRATKTQKVRKVLNGNGTGSTERSAEEHDGSSESPRDQDD